VPDITGFMLKLELDEYKLSEQSDILLMSDLDGSAGFSINSVVKHAIPVIIHAMHVAMINILVVLIVITYDSSATGLLADLLYLAVVDRFSIIPVRFSATCFGGIIGDLAETSGSINLK
jgi:hypothetical protein